jgi:subtilase family serine protease
VDQLGALHGINILEASGLDGNGQNIALHKLASHSSADIAAYASCFHLTNAVATESVDGGGQSGGGGTAEADADFEEAATLAPGASFTYFEGPNSAQGAYDTWDAIVSGDTSTVISTSWGSCEELADEEQEISTLDPLFEQAASQGQTVLSASGDQGSEECFLDAGSTELDPQYPSADPWVTAVGGTSLLAPGDEAVWNDCATTTTVTCAESGGGAGGGGLARDDARPSWEPNADDWSNSSNPCGSSCREVPDISANSGVGQTYFIDGA